MYANFTESKESGKSMRIWFWNLILNCTVIVLFQTLLKLPNWYLSLLLVSWLGSRILGECG